MYHSHFHPPQLRCGVHQKAGAGAGRAKQQNKSGHRLVLQVGQVLDKDSKSNVADLREVASIVEVQDALQSCSTPMENKRQYLGKWTLLCIGVVIVLTTVYPVLAYNTVRVVEVMDQDTHHVINVEFHNRSKQAPHHIGKLKGAQYAKLGLARKCW